MCPVSIFPQTMRAEVAQHGQRRRTEAPIPQGFVGSNPTLRTKNQLLEKLLTLTAQFFVGEIPKMPVVQINVWSGISLENKKKMVQGITKVLEDSAFQAKPSPS
jgi:hypothetical protein